MENSKDLLEMALQLKPLDRFLLVEGLIRSLDEPNKDIDEIWTKEAAKRLQAHREGRTKGIPYNKVFEERGSNIRIVSCRKATSTERKLYEENKG